MKENGLERHQDRAQVSRSNKLTEALTLASFVLAPWLVFFSSPPMPRVGVWYQSEPLIVGVFGIASLCAAGLLIAALNTLTRAHAMVAVVHPAVLMPVAVFAWSVAMMPFTEFPLLSLYGAPQTGFGAAWFLAVAAMTSGFRYLMFSSSLKKLRNFVAGYFVVAICTVTILGVFGQGDWRPFFYTDHLAFVAIFGWIFLCGFFPARRIFFVVATIGCGFVLILSENRAGYVALIAMPCLYALVAWLVSAKHERFGRMTTIFVLSSVILLVPTLVSLIGSSDFLKELPTSISNTIKSRALMLDVVQGTLNTNLVNYLTGKGWGVFSENLLLQLPFTETSFYSRSNLAGEALWFWDALWRFDFNSHNLFAEVVLSGGLPAGIFVVIWLGYTVYTAPRWKLPLAAAGIGGFVFISGIWFQTPLTAPFMAMALAAVTGRAWPTCKGRPRFSGNSFLKKPVLAGLALSAIVLSAATIDYATFAIRAARAVEGNFVAAPKGSSDDAELIADQFRGHYHFAEVMRNYVAGIVSDLKSGTVLEPWKAVRLERFMEQADRRFVEGAPIHIGVRALNTRSDLIFFVRNKELGAPFNARIESWGALLDKMLVRYPEREDLSVAYHLWLLNEGREEQLLERSEKLLRFNPRSPIGLWFSGVVLLGDKKRSPEGMMRLHRALINGIERYMPVDKKLKESIMQG